ncbi:dUTP diphosphatase [Metabacillus indicus]|uniref:dUTP diphosphatase n=1 Tax=Metabacillus indicus TaxID=246786 RepID=UPI003983F0B5
MNLTKLFEMQHTLDMKIEKQHGLEKESLIHKKILALYVEVGELANETRCFKFWSLKPPAETDVILEEYVDGVHFILSLGIEIEKTSGIEMQQNAEEKTLTAHFADVFNAIAEFEKNHEDEQFTLLFSKYMHLGQALGFSGAQIEDAYMKKNEVNHDRQKQGY